MKAGIRRLGLISFCMGVASAALWAQDGETLYRTKCSTCHESGLSRAQNRESFKLKSPEQIITALEKGLMKEQGRTISRVERRTVAEFLSDKQLTSEPLSAMPRSAYCSGPVSVLQDTPSEPGWNGWGVSVANTRFQAAAAAGISAQDVPRLKLKWAFGFPGAVSASSQIVVWDGRIFVGSWEGIVYSLDAKSGCIYWTFEATDSVRSAISIGKGPGGRLAAYFGDFSANVYAVEAANGKQLWKVKVEDHPSAHITGSPTLSNGRLYVPMSSREENVGSYPSYQCCKFRGSVTTLDAATGKRIWKTYTIPELPHPTHKNRAGTQLWGPSGAALWNSPTVDVKRKAVYVATGNAYSFPPAGTTDAIIAMDMDTGKFRWVRQLTGNDVWVSGGCQGYDPAVCAKGAPDFDFGSSAMLLERSGEGDLLLATQKSGIVYALDPDREGKLLWQQGLSPIAVKGPGFGGIVFGAATDGEKVYAPLFGTGSRASPEGAGEQPAPSYGGGLVAVAVGNGQKLWNTPPPICGDQNPCTQQLSAAVTAIPGAVFSGSMDGHLRAYSSQDGKIIWDFDTAREYTTVNGVQAKGGSFNQGGPAVVGGMVFTNSGYSRLRGSLLGNVLLAFSVE